MKVKNLKKLTLTKKTIADLTNFELLEARGGISANCNTEGRTICVTNCLLTSCNTKMLTDCC